MQTPPSAWLAVVVAVIACASGGVWFLLLGTSPPILRSSWRLGMTSVLLIPGFVWEARGLSDEMKQRVGIELPKLVGAGMVLGTHFAAWSVSLDWTSLPHSLLFVCSTPLLIVGWRIVRVVSDMIRLKRWGILFEQGPTRLEVLGSVVGFAAAGMLAADATSTSSSSPNNTTLTEASPAPSLRGDAMAILGAAAMGIYLNVGASMRKWLPLFVYVFPVTTSAAIFTGVISVVFEHGSSLDLLFAGVFATPYVFGVVLGSAFCAGILGHTAANYALPWVGSLTVSVALLFEPLVGSIMGFFAGLTPAPGVLTYVAGFPLMLSAVLVTLGSRDSSESSSSSAAARVEPVDPQHQVQDQQQQNEDQVALAKS